MFNTPEELIEDVRQGRMVILVDDEDRENEGDIIVAAEKITPEIVNFMVTYGRGLLCLTLTPERCQQLNLEPMVKHNTAQFSTAFTTSIEAAEGISTGISAADRATTILTAVAQDAKPCDLVQPGHVFPLIAQPGGVLTRSGHTEAGTDLARLAGFEPAAAIVEVLNEDGSMARRDDLIAFGQQHNIKIGTIAALIEYRNHNETTIERVAECQLPTDFGDFTLVTYRDVIDNQLHYALHKGDISRDKPTLVRVHLQSLFADILSTNRQADRSWSLPAAMQRIAEQGGVLVLLGREESNDEIISVLQNFAAEDRGERAPAAKWQGTSRRVGVGSQILADLGVGKMVLMTSKTKRYHALSGFGLDVVDYIYE